MATGVAVLVGVGVAVVRPPGVRRRAVDPDVDGVVGDRAAGGVGAAVTAAVWIVALGAPGGTSSRTEPRSRFRSRVPSFKLKIVFSPRRVMVRSVKVNSARDCVPVRTAVPWLTLSFIAAGCGGAFVANKRTS